MKDALKQSGGLFWAGYKLLAFVIGSVVMFLLSVVLFYEGFFARPSSYAHVIHLQSGFVYHYDMQDGSANGYHIEDKSHQLVVYSDVIRFKEHGPYIYGYREDLFGNPFYFLCRSGEDCSQGQNLSDVDLRRLIQEKSLPLFTRNSGFSKQDFDDEAVNLHQEPECHELRWAFDAKAERYRATCE